MPGITTPADIKKPLLNNSIKEMFVFSSLRVLVLYSNAIKYILRAGHKSEEGYSEADKTIEDLQKAIFYLNDKIELIKKIKDLD